MTVVSDVNVMGVLAQFGRGMIQDVSDQLFQKFTDAMRRQLDACPGATPPRSCQRLPARCRRSSGGQRSRSARRHLRRRRRAATARQGDVLDVGSLGAQAAGRAAARTLRPGFWIAFIVLALLVYWLVRR